jgi:hypothetical protein
MDRADIDEESTDRAGTGTVGIDSEKVLVRDGIEAQTGQAVINPSAILDAAEASMTSLSRPPSSVRMSRTSRPSTRHTAATCPIPHQRDSAPARFRTSQRRSPRDLLISIGDERVTTLRHPQYGPEPRLW